VKEITMRAPDCPDHAALVLGLARGRLDDPAAEEAEQARRTCPVCAAWWREHLEGPSARVVADTVAQTFSGFQAPRRRLRRAWLAAAAAVILALSGAILWRAGGPTAPPDTSVMIERAFDEPASADGDLNHDGVVDASDLALALRHST
jgi:hypothetical protein